jgi:flagellar hook-associated protein 1 FlgK
MGNLFASLLNSTNALRVYGRALNVIQNNITNVNTPGYAKQDQVLVSQPFDPANGVTGGVAAGPLYSYRSAYQEQAVRNQQELLGHAGQRAADLAQLEAHFDLTSEFGIPAALNRFFNSFSALAVNPNNSVSRQGALDAAAAVAQSFHQVAAGIAQASSNAAGQTRAAVDAVNRLAQRIADLNRQYRTNAGAGADAGLDAQMHAVLEELSGIVNFTLIRTPDGAVNVYLGGQTILVIGDRARALSADFSTPKTILRDSEGNDVTQQATGGQLGALVEERNATLPAYLADLNTLAQAFADAINAALAAGVDKNGLPPAVNLFSYNAGLGAAATLATGALTPEEIAAALPAAPGGNGNAIVIAQLGAAPAIGGFSFIQFFGNLGARLGRDVAAARQEREQRQDAVLLARQRRNELSGVSLDEEAAKLLQFQQAYQAAGKLVAVLSELTESVINIIR